MSALTVIFCIWTMVAMCAVLFIRGASPRIERPIEEKRPKRTKRERHTDFSIVE